MTKPSEEEIARVLCKAEGTAQCAALCLSRFSSDTEKGKCPEALHVWGHKARAVLAALAAAPRTEEDQLVEHFEKLAPQFREAHAALIERVAAAPRTEPSGYDLERRLYEGELAQRKGWNEAIEAAAVDLQEWAEVNERLGNKEQAVAYRNAVASISALKKDGTNDNT